MRPSAILEAAVNVVLAATLLWPIRMRLWDIARIIPRRYVLFCALGWILMVAGQTISNGNATYPFPPWNMYTSSKPGDPHFVDYMAELSSGREVRLLIAQLFPASGTVFRGQVDSAAYSIQRLQDGSDERQPTADLDALLAGVARQYDARNPGERIRTIRVWIGTIPVRSYKGPASISRRLVREYHAP
jgi:hypothetical protein